MLQARQRAWRSNDTGMPRCVRSPSGSLPRHAGLWILLTKLTIRPGNFGEVIIDTRQDPTMLKNPTANGLVTWVAEDPIWQHDPHASPLTEPLDCALDKQNLRGDSVHASLTKNPCPIFFATPVPGYAISIRVKQLRIGNGDIRSERWVRHEHVDGSEADLFTGGFYTTG